MVAGDGIGMAPGAQFIAARVFNDSGVSTDSAVHLAFQWLLDPDGNPATDDAPDVVNASWGALLATCDTEFEPDLQALRAANILPVFAAGNSGPGPSSDTSPGNLPEAFAVGATATDTTIAAFSSLGPSRCGNAFPSLVAAGTGIRSTDRFGLGATGLAGTSFAAPHVAGALALLLQLAPHLTADEQAALLTQSARDLGAPGPDPTFGAGSLDVGAAARLLSPSLDLSPPVISGAAFSDGTIRAHAADASSAIAGAEWWADADPGVGLGAPLTAADGTLDSLGEDLLASPVALAPGDHVIGLRARDAAGNWSPALLVPVSVPVPPAATSPASVPGSPRSVMSVAPPLPLSQLVLTASDDFERGLGSWHLRGRVATSREAATYGRRGLRVSVAGGERAFIGRLLPQAGDELELRFDLNPRTISTRAWSPVAAIDGPEGSAGRLHRPARHCARLRAAARERERGHASGGAIAAAVRPTHAPSRSRSLWLTRARASAPAGSTAGLRERTSRRLPRTRSPWILAPGTCRFHRLLRHRPRHCAYGTRGDLIPVVIHHGAHHASPSSLPRPRRRRPGAGRRARRHHVRRVGAAQEQRGGKTTQVRLCQHGQARQRLRHEPSDQGSHDRRG